MPLANTYQLQYFIAIASHHLFMYRLESLAGGHGIASFKAQEGESAAILFYYLRQGFRLPQLCHKAWCYLYSALLPQWIWWRL